jgi:2-oxoglutarate ferredoxin oxidoreductase subunit delta
MAGKRLRIYPEKCKGCMLCVNACPKGLLKASEGVNEKGLRYVEIEFPEKCSGCGMCYMMCPDGGLEVVEKDGQ